MIPVTPKNQNYHSRLNDEPVERLSITISFEINEEEEGESESDFSADLRNMDEFASYSTPKPTSSSSLKLRKKTKTQDSISKDEPRYITPDLMMPTLDEPPKMMRCASSFSSRNNQEREYEDNEVILRNILPSISFEDYLVLRNKELPSSSSLLSRKQSHNVPKLSNEITILPQRSKSIDLNANTSKRKPLSSDIPSHLLMPTF